MRAHIAICVCICLWLLLVVIMAIDAYVSRCLAVLICGFLGLLVSYSEERGLLHFISPNLVDVWAKFYTFLPRLHLLACG